jgi:hypothetical protein
MGILLDEEKNRLLARDGLKRFVNQEEPKYVKILRQFKGDLRNNPKWITPEMLFRQLEGYLRVYDPKLADLLYSIFGNDNAKIDEFYMIIAKYFVDREAAT